MSMIDAMIQELEQEAQTTRRVLERVPGDRLGWQPHPKSMSVGQLALHVATLPGAVSTIVRQSPFQVPPFVQPAATSVAELVPALEASVTQAKENLRAIGEPGLAAVWRLVHGDREVMAAPVGAVFALHHAEPLVPPPGAAVGVPEGAERAAAVDLRPERGRESVHGRTRTGRHGVTPVRP